MMGKLALAIFFVVASLTLLNETHLLLIFCLYCGRQGGKARSEAVRVWMRKDADRTIARQVVVGWRRG